MKVPRLLLIPAIALIPLLPYALGYSGQDLNFHLASWLEIRAAWQAGHLLPLWAAGANFNLGDPHLGFYPPISFLLGALLLFLFSVALAPAAFVWITLCLSGFSMYFVAGRFVAAKDRLAAAALYMLSPYLVATVLVRFAAGELLVQAWLPFVLLAAFHVMRLTPAPRLAVTSLGTLLALSWLTSIPASIVLFYSLLLLATFVCYRQRSLHPLLRILFAEVVAFALAAFRLLPTWAERSFIHQASLIGNDPRKYLLFLPQARFPDGVLMCVFWTLGVGIFLLILAAQHRRTVPLARDNAVLAAALACIAVLLQTPLAYPVWTWLPQLASVQFPFRFQMLEGAVLPLLLFAPATPQTLRKPVYLAALALNTLPLLLFVSMRTADHGQPLAARVAAWRIYGYKGAPEYLPAHGSAVSGNLPVQVATPNPRCHLTVEPSGRAIHTESPDPCPLRFPIYFYPYWQASADSSQSIAVLPSANGLLELTAPPGNHTITLTFRAASRLRTLATIVSLLTVALLLTSFVIDNQPALWVETISTPKNPIPPSSSVFL